MGYSSLGVALFKYLKSIHALTLLDPFFSTGTILEIHSSDLQGLIKLALSNRPIYSLIRSYILGLNFLVVCLEGLKPFFIGNRCSTSSRLKPGIRSEEHTSELQSR